MFNKFLVKKLDLNNLEKIGIDDFYVNCVSDLKSAKDNSIIFINKWDNTLINKINLFNECIIILPKTNNYKKLNIIKNNNLVILSNNPRLRYAIILNDILDSTSNNKKYTEKEFFFDYLKKQIKPKRKMGHLTIIENK